MAPVRRTAVLLAATALAGALAAWPAAAHGSMQNPLSRVQGCYLEGPEHPGSAACRAAIAVSGPQGAYDWMGVRIGDANGRHRELIPDGKLCSAGDPEFAGFDLPRADWPATTLTPGAPYTFRFRVTAAHRGTFRLYLTKAGYDPTRPLRWADLSDTPFLTVTDPPATDGQYVLPGTVPAGLTGRHLLYAIWQRSDSPEAFYSCSDVQLGSAAPTTAAPSTAAPTTAPASASASSPAIGAPTAAAAAAHVHDTATATGPVPSPTPLQLAQTGSTSANGVLLSLGSVLLLTGAAFAVLHRRRPKHARRAG
ncbi:lytic polysaccharide monooxygenase [Streptomyces sp. TLI_171]|uniref:lytic polysaccharide monooxygenase auxiliary activity family 9 protein n=1 Tax=Streptomyces sp. TLI_171 TaxID=1938859 RepID=UPI000C179A61|nr:lytic polysaccharide monooxygenase [Streptomyces sp. TLI_171]RKE19219.1 LPXTG-motif cell wall-anchored protein [Streptomyces sp. TLI_171]